MSSSRLLLASSAAVAAIGFACPASAEVDAATAERLKRIEAQLAAQAQRLEQQEQRLMQQEQLIQSQSLEIHGLHSQRDQLLEDIRAGHALAVDAESPSSTAVAAAAPQAGPTPDEIPSRPVGEAPPPAEHQIREVAAVPESAGVLTPRGQLVIDPSFEYVRTSNNRLVFRGIAIVPGVQLGVIEASDADRDALTGTIAARYGLTNRIEVEARVPYTYRQDRITELEQNQVGGVTRSRKLEGQDLGDIEFAARYQINSGANGWPIFVANARVKPPTGVGPYDVRYNVAGIATELATGSGFWGYELGATAIYPTDPAVIFGSLSYLYNAPKDVNKDIGSGNDKLHVGSVDPGDSISASIGFGLALNSRFSFSLGYSHAYIFKTDTDIGPTTQRSNSLSVGSMLMGLSYRLNDRVSVNNNFEFGMTADAPDMRLVVRVPYRF